MSQSPEAAGAIILVRGQVQGVGFRPFVYRLARHLGLVGRVSNDATGVLIRVEGPERALAGLRGALRANAPPSARIEEIAEEPAPLVGFTSFEIEASGPSGRPLVRVPRDLATCPECRREAFDADDRRYGYPFANCTACGPRFSIIDRLPYDRSSTSMRRFTLCLACLEEYEQPADRRFHAEPIACASCGPRATFREAGGLELARGHDAIGAAADAIRAGRVIAIKGLGGFQLLVRADLSAPVAVLRERKGRPTKPLAVMVPTLEAARRLGHIGPAELRLLRSPENPIVLLERRTNPLTPLAPEVAPRVGTVGVLLPTTPMHHLLLSAFDLPVVVTSGNRGANPLCIDEAEAFRDLAGIADAFLVHDRPIVRRLDDSVVRMIAGCTVTIRMARGSAPLPLPAVERLAAAIQAGGVVLPSVLATGGHQKVASAFWNGAQAILGPHVGDMDGAAARDAFEGHVADLAHLYGGGPGVLACDLHPDYFTSRWTSDLGLPVVRVQHHHAHAVAAMIEQDLLGREVLALAWDGTGYGPDGTLWGGEILRARVDRYARVASLRKFPLPGGEAAIRQPRRVALGLLAQALGEETVLGNPTLLRRLGLSRTGAERLLLAIRRGIHTPWTSSVGRLFDGIAALVLDAGEVTHEGEAATWLESVAYPEPTEGYQISEEPSDDPSDPQFRRGDWRPLIVGVLTDLDRGVAAGRIAARFHDALARWAAASVARQPSREVVLGGGCFQNRRLTEATVEAIRSAGARAYSPGMIPAGDGGLAAGQLAVALAILGRCPRRSASGRYS